MIWLPAGKMLPHILTHIHPQLPILVVRHCERIQNKMICFWSAIGNIQLFGKNKSIYMHWPFARQYRSFCIPMYVHWNHFHNEIWTIKQQQKKRTKSNRESSWNGSAFQNVFGEMNVTKYIAKPNVTKWKLRVDQKPSMRGKLDQHTNISYHQSTPQYKRKPQI